MMDLAQFVLLQLLLIVSIYAINASKPCVLRQFKTGLVCVCNTTYCDTFEFDNPVAGEFLIASTSRGGLRHTLNRGKLNTDETLQVQDEKYLHRRPKQGANYQNLIFSFFSSAATNSYNDKPVDEVNVTINQEKSYQKIVGFGGAFTGSVSHNLKLIKEELQTHVYRSYYSKTEGNGYSIMRIPIGGCDFDLSPWAYNEMPTHDRHLSNFTKLDQRDIDKLEQIEVLKKVSNNHDIKFVGAAWSSPRWMKTNNDWTGFGSLKEQYYQTWADYHVRYLELMSQKNLTFWAISTGNEPMNAVIGFLFVHFMSLGWIGRTQGKWVSENFGPAIKNNTQFSNVKLLAGDDQRYTYPWWFTQMEEAYPGVLDMIDGFAVHWYWDSIVPSTLIDDTHAKYPDKLYLSTEACSGDKPWEVHGPVIGSWSRAEDYAQDILEDLNHWINGWIDWNLILDEKGGPNYANNFVDSAIIANVETGDEFFKQPIFYVMGHFARFLTPDSVRVSSSSSSGNLKVTAFKRPDGYMAVVFHNLENHSVDVNLSDGKHGTIKLNVPQKSIHSILYK